MEGYEQADDGRHESKAATEEPRQSEVELIGKEITALSETISRLEDRLSPVLGMASPIAEVSDKASGSALFEARLRLHDHVTYLRRLIDRIEA